MKIIIQTFLPEDWRLNLSLPRVSFFTIQFSIFVSRRLEKTILPESLWHTTFKLLYCLKINSLDSFKPVFNSLNMIKFSNSSSRLEISIKGLQEKALVGISSVTASTSIYNRSFVWTLIENSDCKYLGGSFFFLVFKWTDIKVKKA